MTTRYTAPNRTSRFMDKKVKVKVFHRQFAVRAVGYLRPPVSWAQHMKAKARSFSLLLSPFLIRKKYLCNAGLFIQRGNTCRVFLKMESIKKEVFYQKNLMPRGATSFLLELTPTHPLEIGGKNEDDKVISHSHYLQ